MTDRLLITAKKLENPLDLCINRKSTQRVQAYRARLKEAGCQRLDVIIGSDVIERVRAAAQALGIPMSQAVEIALEHWASSVAGNEGD